ncbi:MAG: BamA/TamA family outer membrane protein [Chitinophagaceae bacterium]|nr:BamA/TamA family outer membrane protein [Chitinophagaceae bacterium]
MKRYILKGVFILSQLLSFVIAQENNNGRIVQRIFLTGDAGELKNGKHLVCDWLKQHVNWDDSSNTLIYLGDNIYPVGLPGEGNKSYAAAKAILDYQVSVVQGKSAKAFFIPGNHDWKKGKTGGLEQARQQWNYITKLGLPNVQVLPANGCPGPVEVLLGDKVVIVFMDSQWWLQQGEKTDLESDCDYKTEEEVVTALKDIIGSYPDRLILLAMHHPFYTYGAHGGYFTLKQHIFPLTDASPGLYIPLPVIGSVYPLARGVFGNIQDTKHPQYKNMIRRIEEIMKLHPNVIHAAGHEHSLQFLLHDSIPYIVSGSASKTTRVRKGKKSLFAKEENGFAVVEVTSDGKAEVKFYTLSGNGLQQPVFVKKLNDLPVLQKTTEELVRSFPDSVMVTGSEKFRSNGIRHLLLGKNYRREWKTPIRVPVINLGKEYGGLTPLKRGGGHQTQSLRLEDPSGKQYVMRLVEKAVTDAALPPDLRGTFVKDLVSDGVSASYPYAALSVPPLAEAVGVPHTQPRLVYIPDDPRLGKFRTDFANRFALFEERVPGNVKKSYSTDEMVEKLKDDNDNELDQQALLKARLLDMFMMDWDRHEDQWRWGVEDNGKGKTYYPIPRDRDQPFFVSSGLLPSVARKPWISPQVQGFRTKAININTYNFNARNVDRAFLSEPDESDWKKAIQAFLPLMTDELIEKALSLQPAAIKDLPRNKEIIEKLKERRKYFADEMIGYYRFLSKIVSVTASDKNELFDITRNSDGSVMVQVFKITKEGEQAKKMYERKFDPAVTKEIRLYAMGGDDKFVVHGGGGKIRIRMIGGSGNDVFESNASSPAGKNMAYDTDREPNTVKGSIHSKISDDPDVNKYERLYYAYNQNIPFLSFNFNPDDGLFLGASFKMIRHGFRKKPYKAMHQLAVNHALATKAYNFKWNSEFIGVLGKKGDLLFNADIKAPNATANFFGYGNGSVYDKTKPGQFRYYRARYQAGDISLVMRKNMGTTASMTIGPAFQFFSLDTDDNKERFILNTASNGLDPGTLFSKQSFAGGVLTFSIDNRNSKSLPSRGINWLTSVKALKGLNDNSHSVTQVRSDMSLFISFSKQAGFVLATRFGAGHNFGDFEFFQAQYVGGLDNLRGYRRYRFAGRSMAYNNTEIRVKLADFRTYLFPGSLGLLLFHDMGRVWADNDPVNKWKTGYGGGVWFAPLRKLVTTISYTVSNEDKIPLVSLGWQF